MTKITPLTFLTFSALGSLHAATISTANLGALDLSASGLSIVHGTDLTNPRIQQAMWDATGIFLSTTEGSRLGAYDTEAVYTKAQRAAGLADDPDLERRSNNPPGANRNEWAGGNLDLHTQLGIIAIVQDRHSYGYLNPGSLAPVFASPNDQASGGTITLDLAPSLGIQKFTVSVIDAENEGNDFYHVLVNDTYSVDFVANAFAQDLNPVFGGRTLNTLGSIDIAELSGGRDSVITRVDYIIGNDSGGTGGFLFESGATPQSNPEPSTALLSLFALLGLTRRSR